MTEYPSPREFREEVDAMETLWGARRVTLTVIDAYEAALEERDEAREFAMWLYDVADVPPVKGYPPEWLLEDGDET